MKDYMITKEIVTDFTIGIAISIPPVIITSKKKALTIPAALASAVYVTIICILSSWIEAVFLIGMYFTVFTVDMVFHKKDKKFETNKQRKNEISKEKGSPRKMKQIIANGFAGLSFLFLRYLLKNRVFLIAYYASIFEVMTDSVASDVGVLSKNAPWDICTRKKISPGMSGGVSFLGLGASAIVCIIAGITAAGVKHWKIYEAVIVIIASYTGMILDSVLGSQLQVKYKCKSCGIYTENITHCGKKSVYSKGLPFLTNSMVNFICTILAGMMAWINILI